jgi:hypothetical protein
MPQPLILTWATAPSNQTQWHPKCVQSPWGKYSYKRLPRGFGGSAGIFQAQIMDLMAVLKFVRVYMDDLLIITRETLDEHLQKMETVLTRLRDAGLKVNAAKSLFCAHEIEYLDYILNREGIKPQPKKVQAILALSPPNNVKELTAYVLSPFWQEKNS